MRRRSVSLDVPDILFERRFTPREASAGLLRDLVRSIAADELYDLAFVRKLRAWLRQGRLDVVLEQIAWKGKLSPSEAEAFLARCRDGITQGKVPPRE